jgi:fimbrial chaperone protein
MRTACCWPSTSEAGGGQQPRIRLRRLGWRALAIAWAVALPARGAEVFVSPVRAELKGATLSETITVTNRGGAPMRVGVKVMEWTQDAQGNDVYKDTADLVYFPRQVDLAPDSKRPVRVGATIAPGGSERTWRMFIEEQPLAAPDPGNAQIAVYLRVGVPVFLPPTQPRAEHELGEPTLEHGKVLLRVRNTGNQHLRLLRLKVDDGAGFAREIAGWYTLAGAQRTYSVEVPADVCRKAKTLHLAIEGEGIQADRKLNVDATRCT